MSDDLKRIHDELLGVKPDGVEHPADCIICLDESPETTNHRQTAEESGMEHATLTQDQHEALLTSAVQREVAEALKEREDELAELRTRIDTLEAEKASLAQERDDARQKFEDRERQLEEEAALAEVAETREAEVREIASHLGDDYFTEARVARWATYDDGQYEDLLDSMTEGAIARLGAEDAALLEGLEGAARRAKVVEITTAKATREAADEKALQGGFRETAAFSGGKTPSSRGQGGSATRRSFLGIPTTV